MRTYSRAAALAFTFLCLFSITLFISSPVKAATTTITVTTLADSGAGSLRQAILDANGSTDDYVIDFDSSLNGATITLTSGALTVANNGSLTIDGGGKVTISGNNASRVFVVQSGADVTLAGLTIIDGSALFGGGVRNNGGMLTINNSTFSSNTATSVSSGGAIYNTSGTLIVSGSTFTSNTAMGPGGAISVNNGDAKIVNSTFSGNTSDAGSGGSGGAIFVDNSAVLLLINSTISANYARSQGNGLYLNSGTTVTIQNSIIANNTGGGADCETAGSPTIQYSLIKDGGCGITSGVNGNLTGDPDLGTLTGSPAYYPLNYGSSAIDAGSNALAVEADGVTTLTSDQAGHDRIYNSTVDLGSYEFRPVVSISSANASISEGGSTDITITRDGDVSSSLFFSYHVSFGTGTTTGDYSISGDVAGNNPSLDYITFFPAGVSELTGTILATVNSVGAEADNTITYGVASGGSSYVLGTGSATITILANDLEVTNANDSGDGSLRQAITNADSFGGSNTITFRSSVFSTAQTIMLGSALPNITDTVIINGPGADLLTVDGAGSYRPFTVNGGKHLTIDSLTIANGSAPNGGGIQNGNGTLIVTNSTLSGNSATNYGGGIYNGGGTLIVTDSTLSGNSVTHYGGAIHNLGGTMTVSGSTFTGNSADTDGGGMHLLGGTVTVSDSTFTGNSANRGGGIYVADGSPTVINSTMTANSSGFGGGLYNDNGTTTIINSTVAGNMASADGSGITNGTTNGSTLNLNNSIVAGNTGGEGTKQCLNRNDANTINARNSLIEDGLTCVNGTNTNNLTGDPLLGALANNGGPTQTMALLDGSPAINTGDNALAVDADSNPLTTDQRGSGYDRVFGSIVDMGAYELTYTQALVVDTTSDDDLEDCSPVPGDCSLRGAITLANTTFAGADTITFNSTVFSTAQTITLGGNLPDITTDMTINGPGADLLTVDGANNYRPFTVDSGADLTLDGLTIANGKSTTSGGGISNSGALTLIDSTLDSNSAPYGGGIDAISGTVIVSSSTFVGNRETGANGGGAIYNHPGSTLTVVNSTFSGNSANSGGGMRNLGSATVTNSTFSGNSASAGGGITNNGTLRLYNSIIANTTGGDDCRYASGSLSVQNSLIADGSCNVTSGVAGNLTGDPSLGALTGSPAYYPLNLDSSAINAGANDLAVDADSNMLTTDEAGNARIVAGTVDMGAYEAQLTDCPTFPYTVPASASGRSNTLSLAPTTTARARTT